MNILFLKISFIHFKDIHSNSLSSGSSTSKPAFAHKVVDLDPAVPHSRKFSVAITGIVNENIDKQPCSSGSAYGQDTQFTTLVEMFPLFDEVKIHAALVGANFDIEIAVAKILSSSSANSTPQQVYAALGFCNAFDNEEEQDQLRASHK